MTRTETKEVLKKIRAQLQKRGTSGVEALARFFRIMDTDKNGVFSKEETSLAFKKCGVQLSEKELRLVFDDFDTSGDQLVSFDELLRGIKGAMNKSRVSLVKKAFDSLDIDGSGEISLDELASKFNTRRHPKVLSGELGEKQALAEFLSQFDTHKAEFRDYYDTVSSNIDDDGYFALMMHNAWDLDGSMRETNAKKAWGSGQAGTTGPAAPVQRRAADPGLDRRLDQLERTIKKKIWEKSKEDERRALTRAFRFFDTDASGCVNVAEFTKALERFGIDSQEDVRGLFRRYDIDHSNALEYNEFADALFNKKTIYDVMSSDNDPRPIKQMKEPVPGMPDLDSVLEKIRTQLKHRGSDGINGLGRFFRIMDTDRSGALDREELKGALQKYGLKLKGPERAALYHYFDIDGDGQISFDELLKQLRGRMPRSRRDVVRKVFALLDKDASGEVDLAEISAIFNARSHPQVRSGEITESEVYRTFMDNFESEGSRDGKITFQEFEAYYAGISANIDRDDYFNQLVRSAWDLDGTMNAARRRKGAALHL